eukprot:SAG11_NODE_3757_length_2248_cov_2.761284_3_plen_36_part_01
MYGDFHFLVNKIFYFLFLWGSDLLKLLRVLPTIVAP